MKYMSKLDYILNKLFWIATGALIGSIIDWAIHLH
jgi:hypothetical protein